MENFLPLNGFVGGLLIGLSAAFFLLMSGRITGISGIMEGALKPEGERRGWRIAYLLSIPLGAWLAVALAPGMVPAVRLPSETALLLVGGFIAGFGARIGNGCTSGHGICGVARLSKRSIVSTVIFFAVAALTVYAVRHLA